MKINDNIKVIVFNNKYTKFQTFNNKKKGFLVYLKKLFFLFIISLFIIIIRIVKLNGTYFKIIINKITNNKTKESTLQFLIRKNNITKEDRILVYTCCDGLYSHYIPIFCSTLLKSDKLKLIDIEIGVNINKLTNNEEKALDYLREKYYYSKIKIKYNYFIKNKTGTYYNNIKILSNSVRFISEPIIKNKYVYITDVDIFILNDNFFINLIDDMKRKKNRYSNLVRPNSNHLTGLHFTEYDAYYPIPKQENYYINDEVLLYNIVKSKGIKIDTNTSYRPNPGIHASLSRPHVSNVGYVGWLAERYKINWIEYCRSEDFKFIYSLLDKIILHQISKLNDYYGISEENFKEIISSNL